MEVIKGERKIIDVAGMASEVKVLQRFNKSLEKCAEVCEDNQSALATSKLCSWGKWM